MVTSKPQLGLVGLDDPAELARDADDQALVFEGLLAACRACARLLTVEVCARELDRIWGDRGRPVSAAVLRAALNGTERNYFRLEWAIWFARQSEDVAELLLEIVGQGKPKKTPEEELADLKKLVRDELSHKRAEALIRKAETT